MFSSTSAAVAIRATLFLGAWASFALSARGGQSAAPTTQTQPITTQAAFESWLAWYHLHPKTPADANGPRFRQLLSAADGDRYFLRGIDDGSPQVRELSKQGLIKSLGSLSNVELRARLRNLDSESRRRAQDILLGSCDWSGPPPQFDKPSQYGLEFQWGIPFGGLMRVALASQDRTMQPRTELPECDLDAEIAGLESAINEIDYWPCSPEVRDSWSAGLRHVLAQVQLRKSSRDSARSLLVLLDQSGQSPPFGEVTVEHVKQALLQHIGLPVVADQHAHDPDSKPVSPWPAYRARVRLERQVETPRVALGDLFRPEGKPSEPVSWCDDRYKPYPLTLAHGDRCRPHCDPRSVTADEKSKPVITEWTDCPISEAATLAPGTYKLLLAFESPTARRVGFGDHTVWTPQAAAVVFRVIGPEQPASATNIPSESPGPTSLDQPASWQVLQVAFNTSTLEGDDLCVPALSTFAAQAWRRSQLGLFGTGMAR